MHFMAKPIEHQVALPLVAKQQWLESVELANARKETMTLDNICMNHGSCKHG